MSSEKDLEYVLNNMSFLASMHDLELTDNAPKIAKAKLMFFGKDNYVRCPCDPDSDRACISEHCLKDIVKDGMCHCRCYKLKGADND